MKKCSVCGKFITSGYVFDGTDCYCSEECLKSMFPDDPAAADILIDEGERIVWQDCIGTTKTFDDVLALLSDDEKQLLADTINFGGWGSTSMGFFNDNGEVSEEMCYGYITNMAKDAGHFSGHKVSAMFRSIYRKIENKKPDAWLKWTGAGEITCHYNNWWGDGSGDVLFIREPFDEVAEEWAKNYNK